jgi:hypothetical protein
MLDDDGRAATFGSGDIHAVKDHSVDFAVDFIEQIAPDAIPRRLQTPRLFENKHISNAPIPCACGHWQPLFSIALSPVAAAKVRPGLWEDRRQRL